MAWLNNTVATVWRAGHAVGGVLSPRAGDTPGPGADWWYQDVGNGGRNQAGVVVSPDVALKASAVYACVKVLAETISTLPLQMYRELGDAGRTPASDHPLDEVIRYQPNAWQTAVEFWEMMILHAALRGAAYAEIVPGARGAVDQLKPLHTDRVQVEQMADGSLRYQVTNPKTGQRRTLLQEEVLRIPGMSSDGIRGLRVVDLASEAIGLGMAADAYAARVFSNKLNIGGYLVHPGKLGPEAQKNLIQALVERFAGIGNFHRPMVLQEGMQFHKATMDAKEAQLLEARKWQIGEVARYWRVPLHMLGVDDQTNRSTVEAQAIDFVKYTLRPWIKKIEQAIRRDLIVARTTYSAKYNLEGLLRGDSAARSTYFAAALGASGRAAWMNPNEVRAIEGLNPSDDPRANLLGGMMPATGGASAAGHSPGRLVYKEIAAVRKATMRHADDAEAFRSWVGAFYGGLVSDVMKALDVDNTAARAYCAHAKGEVLAADDVEGLLDRWQASRVQEIERTLDTEKRAEVAE